jgi:hypothetical protein
MDVWWTSRGKCFVRQSIFLFIICTTESLKTNQIHNAYCFHVRVAEKIKYHYIIIS